MIKIVVADDHSLIRSGIIYSIKSRLAIPSLIFEAENGDQVIEHVKREDIATLIMDLNMPDTDAQHLIQTVLAINPLINVLVASVSKEEIFGPIFMKLGARGFISKNVEEQEMLRAIKNVISGSTYVRKDLRDFYEKAMHRDSPYDELSQREKEILCQLAKGETTARLANIMSVSLSTISTHKASIFRKLNISNLIELKALIDIHPL